MRDSRQSGPSRDASGHRVLAGHWERSGHWARLGLITLTVGATAGVGAASSLAAAVTATSASSSDSADVGLTEIVVTARKRTENLRDIPASISAIPDTLIQEAHMTQLDDLGTMVSNLNIFDAHDNSPAVTMRGIGAFEVVQGVGFYANDVQQFEGQTVRPVDIERIEVLKGPQGTLYGGANIGGAIKYVTKDPTSTWQNEATVELGQYKTRNVSAVLSGPITDKLGVRASVYDDNHDGYIYDTYHHEDFGKTIDRGGRLTFVYEPQDATRIRLTANADSFSSSSQNLLYRVSEPPTDPQFLHPYTANEYKYSVDDYFTPSYIRKIFSSTLQIDQQLTDDVALTAITAQFWSYNRGNTDFAKAPIPIDQLFQNQDHRVYSQEVRLASTGHTSLDWLVGVFAQKHDILINNSDINYNGDPANPLVTGTDDDRQDKTQKQYALYGDLTYHQGNWQYELGLRGEYYTAAATAYNTLAPLAPVTPPLSAQLDSAHLSGHQFSPRVSVQYKLSAMTNVYGTISRGFEPADEVEQNFKITAIRPEIATNYELGVKSQLPHGAQFTAALFYINYQDRLYNVMRLDPVLNIVEVETNIGPSQNYGVEMDFSVPLSHEFKLSGGLGTTRAVWGNALYADPQLTAANGGVIVYRNLKGLIAPFTPEYSANLALDWNHVLSNGFKVGARLDGSAVGQSYWDPNDFARQEPYQLMNAGAHLDSGNWTWLAHVSNVTGTRFNTVYWDANDVGAPHSIGKLNRPRTFVVSATVHF
jgi:iron complex outermembrane receptor protein